MTRSARSASSSSKKFDVFEFNEEDARIQKASEKILCKFGNPKKSGNFPVDKYTFLEVFSRGPKTPHESISCDPVDLDAKVKCSAEDVSNKLLEVDDSDMDDQCLYANSYSKEASQKNCTVKEEIPGFGNDSLNMVSDDDGDDDDDSNEIDSSSTSTSTLSPAKVGEDQLLLEHGCTASEVNGIKMAVNVVPDFVMYGNIYSTQSWLTFSCESIRLEESTVNGNRTSFELEWTVEDIIKIESCWCDQVKTAMIKFLLKPKDFRGSGNADQNQGSEQLKFAVYDPYWSEKEEAIKSLDVRFRELWSAIIDTDTDNNENISALGQNSFFCGRRYFPIFDQTFDEVIYPKGDPDAVSVSKRDVELLQPETFINDTIIDFYIKYLKNKIPPGEQQKFHFFNSFFFRKLADLDKDPSSASDGRAAFQRVRKWTRKVNLFEKDYIFIPVNYSYHWSLILICHPGEVIHLKDEKIEESSKVPCILHMDSLKGSHKGLKNLFQSYLFEEWKERHQDMVDEASSKFVNLRFVSLELPQQVNLYDCGLFLLHYVELFLEEGLSNFNPFKISKFSTFLTSNWFLPEEASLKRAHIQKLIFDIFEDNSQKAPPNDCIDEDLSSEIPGIIKHMFADSLGERCYPTWQGNPSSFTCKQETDIQFPAASPVDVTSYDREPGFVSNDLQRAEVNSPSINCQMSTCHQSGYLSPIEEVEEAVEETGVSELAMENSDRIAVLASDCPSLSYFSKDFEASETSQQGFTMNVWEHSSFSKPSTSASWNALETTTEDLPLEGIEGSDLPDKTDKLECSSTAFEELAGFVVEDSQEENERHDVDMSEKSPPFQGSLHSMPHQDSNLAQFIDLEDDTEVGKKESPESEADEPATKRSKLTHAGEERRMTRNMFNVHVNSISI
ncbi:hypothetical protein L6164_036396 [Bauhinia variegata]|uniref:Uncharacterized protein n=1 Tax=Bauhinia variegata TaxID=167791 RepID=A0ACB9KGT5_BAUVA|nr:hypothetical protein L6164_036396 [Bauhinia variegata]